MCKHTPLLLTTTSGNSSGSGRAEPAVQSEAPMHFFALTVVLYGDVGGAQPPTSTLLERHLKSARALLEGGRVGSSE